MIGASNHSASNSVRLLSAVAGSSIILREYLRGALGYVGCVLVMLAISCFWYFVHFKKQEKDIDDKEGDKSMRVDGAREADNSVIESCADIDTENKIILGIS